MRNDKNEEKIKFGEYILHYVSIGVNTWYMSFWVKYILRQTNGTVLGPDLSSRYLFKAELTLPIENIGIWWQITYNS